MRKITARVLTLALVVVAAMMIPGIARADGTITWDGSQGLPDGGCPFGAHWVLSGQAQNITSATLNIGSDSIAMDHNGNEFQAESDTPVDGSTVVTADFVGTKGDTTSLKVSGCLTGTTTTTEPPGTTANTGFNPLPFVGLGLVLLAAGTFALRRRTI